MQGTAKTEKNTSHDAEWITMHTARKKNGNLFCENADRLPFMTYFIQDASPENAQGNTTPLAHKIPGA